MRCPFCDREDTRVLESRPTDEGIVIRRRRACQGCEERFTTYERVETSPLVVIKRDGRREAFERNKILHGLITACEKRPVGLAILETLVTDIEHQLRSGWDREVESKAIGQMVMEGLRDIDQVAYVRFASVYRQFKDVNQFLEELHGLLHTDDDHEMST